MGGGGGGVWQDRGRVMFLRGRGGGGGDTPMLLFLVADTSMKN